MFAVRADQQEILPAFDLSFMEIFLPSCQEEIVVTGVSREGQGMLMVSGSRVPKDLACVVATEK